MLFDNKEKNNKEHSKNKESKGQGSLEYLILIGAAVLVSVIVIVLLTGMTGQTTKESESRLGGFFGMFEKQMLSGLVKDSDGLLVSGAVVELWSGTTKLGSTTTSALGKYKFSDKIIIDTGTYTIKILNPGIYVADGTTSVDITSETEATATPIVLEKYLINGGFENTSYIKFGFINGYPLPCLAGWALGGGNTNEPNPYQAIDSNPRTGKKALEIKTGSAANLISYALSTISPINNTCEKKTKELTTGTYEISAWVKGTRINDGLIFFAGDTATSPQFTEIKKPFTVDSSNINNYIKVVIGKFKITSATRVSIMISLAKIADALFYVDDVELRRCDGFTGCSSAETAPAPIVAAVTGQVIDKVTNVGVPSAIVKLTLETTTITKTTDASGNYSILKSEITNGTYSVIASKTDYFSSNTEQLIYAGQTSIQGPTLAIAPRDLIKIYISGKVTDGTNPISNITVELINGTNNSDIVSKVTDSEGKYSFNGGELESWLAPYNLQINETNYIATDVDLGWFTGKEIIVPDMILTSTLVNLVANPGFENDFTNWQGTDETGTCINSISTIANSGTKSALMTNSGVGDCTIQQNSISLTAGTYELSFYAKSPEEKTLHSGTVDMDFTLTNAFTKYSKQFTISSPTTINLNFTNGADDIGKIYIDDVALIKKS